MESRQAHRDVEDDRTLPQARQDGLIHPKLLWRHDRPYEEPLLWPPDAVAGALGVSMVGGDDSLLRILPAQFLHVAWDGGQI